MQNLHWCAYKHLDYIKVHNVHASNTVPITGNYCHPSPQQNFIKYSPPLLHDIEAWTHVISQFLFYNASSNFAQTGAHKWSLQTKTARAVLDRQINTSLVSHHPNFFNKFFVLFLRRVKAIIMHAITQGGRVELLVSLDISSHRGVSLTKMAIRRVITATPSNIFVIGFTNGSWENI